MTPNAQAAFNAGVEAMRQMALIAAVTIEARDDAMEIRQRAAVAALQGLAEGITALAVEAGRAEDHCLHVDQNNGSTSTTTLQGEP